MAEFYKKLSSISIVSIAYIISSKREIKAVRTGLISIMPLMLIGSFAVLIINLPIEPFQTLMYSVFGDRWKDMPLAIFNGTTQVMSICVLFSISYSLAVDTDLARSGHVNPIMASLISFGCLMTLTNMDEGTISVSQIGATGLFVAIITAIVSHILFFYFFRLKMLKTRLFADAEDVVLTQSLAALEPALWTFIIFGLIKFIPSLFGITDVHAYVYDMLKGIFAGMESSFVSAIVFVLATHIFWFLGLHGNNILENVSQELWTPKLEYNTDLIAAGLPPKEIFTKEFFDVFVFIGGSGSTLCLIAALLLCARKTNTERLTKLSIPLGIFNINEIMIYGLPIVFSPFYFIPFLFAPIILTVITYIALSTGLVPLITSGVIWTTPIGIGGYIATGGSHTGVMLQMLNLVVGTIIYIPFVKMAESFKADLNKKALVSLNSEIEHIETKKPPVHLARMDEIGTLARVLAIDIENGLDDNKGFYLEYQPQIDNDGKMTGCEALLRWNHHRLGRIPPPTIVAIADEAGIATALNEWIYNEAFAMTKKLRDNGYDSIVMSINLSPTEISNKEFLPFLKRLLKKYKLDPRFIDIEVTENVAFDNTADAKKAIKEIKEAGFKLAIDDFGMGHTSLLYIREFEANTVKLDGSLTSDVLTDTSCQDIVRAITSLCKGLGITIIAEVVETEQQRDKLRELGCEIYQGYLYSRPLGEEALLEFLRSGRK